MRLQSFEHVPSSADGEGRRRGLEVGSGGREGEREGGRGREREEEEGRGREREGALSGRY